MKVNEYLERSAGFVWLHSFADEAMCLVIRKSPTLPHISRKSGEVKRKGLIIVIFDLVISIGG